MMKTRLQRTELLRAAQALSTPKCTAAMFLVALLAILTYPTKTCAQEPIAKIGDTPYESLQEAFNAAADGSTITLLDNADIGNADIDIKADEGERNLTFDLNGFSLTGTNEPLYVHHGVNLTVKDGTVGGPDADNLCYVPIHIIGGKVNIENLTISNCRDGIHNEIFGLDEETSVGGELTIGSSVNISATGRCIEHIKGKLTLTALPILSWGEDYYGILLGEGQVINFAGEGITALPEGFKPIKICILDDLPCVITDGYADHVKSGSEVIDPAKVFVGENENISIVLYDGEAMMAYGGIQKVSVTKGNEVKQYYSLQTAFDEAADGSTVTLLDNADIGNADIDIKADEGERNLTFDLNGFSLTGTNEPLYVHHGVNLTVKDGTVGGPDADNPCGIAIRILGGKLNVKNLSIHNCRTGIFNNEGQLDEETRVPGELTIGSGVNISAINICIDNDGELTLTALPILSCGEDYYGIVLGKGQVIHFAGEGITALPEGFKPIKIDEYGKLFCAITNGYADHVKSGSEVIDPAKVFVTDDDDICMVLYDGEAIMKDVDRDIQLVSVTKGDEVKQYYSLQTAFDEAADGSTVTLLDNADLGESTFSIDTNEGEKNLTFDLNGKSLTGTNELFYVHNGVNLTVKGGTVGGPDADNACDIAIRNIGGKVNVESLTISNCREGIYNEKKQLDEETTVAGELTIGSGVNISTTGICIDNYDGILTLTDLPILSWDEEYYGIYLGKGQVIHFAGEGITALPEGFKPIMFFASSELPSAITNGYADHMKSGSEVIDPAKVFAGYADYISMVLYEGEAMMTYGGIQKVSVTKGDEVKEYLSLQTAFDEAADGSTITLLDNADLGKNMIDIWTDGDERNLTFDLNNFSLTGTDELLNVYSGVNLTVKGGTVGGVDADNVCKIAICNLGGKVNIENLTIRNCEYGICNTEDRIDDETRVAGELTIGSGVNINTTGICIEHFKGELTLTALPILSWGEDYYGIILKEGQVISFTGEGITALPEGFKPIKILTKGELPHVITDGYSTFFKNIDPTDVFDAFLFVYDEEEKEEDAIPVSITLEDGEVSAQEPIAKIGDTPYKSLQDAFDAAADGSTITLLDNVNLGDNGIDIRTDGGERNLTFDLNGFSLTGTNELLSVYSGVNLTVKGGTIGGVDADNACENAIRNIGGKMNIENLTISNCEFGICNEKEWLDDKTSVTGELTIGSGVNISSTKICIDNNSGKLTLTALPILSCDEDFCDIYLREGDVINFAGEGITALPEGFKPIMIWADGESSCVITNGYSTFFKNINPADVFDVDNGDESIIVSITLEGGEVRATFIEKSDVNGDGKIDVADVVALTNAIMAGTKDLKYDINCDNKVNHDDVTALVDIILERNDKE